MSVASRVYSRSGSSGVGAGDPSPLPAPGPSAALDAFPPPEVPAELESAPDVDSVRSDPSRSPCEDSASPDGPVSESDPVSDSASRDRESLPAPSLDSPADMSSPDFG